VVIVAVVVWSLPPSRCGRRRYHGVVIVTIAVWSYRRGVVVVAVVVWSSSSSSQCHCGVIITIAVVVSLSSLSRCRCYSSRGVIARCVVIAIAITVVAML
jgi:hypothetical protein